MGRSHALLMAGRGARIVVHDIDPGRVEETAQLVRDAGAPPHGICVDMRDTVALKAAIAATERDYGPIEVLVNNAGKRTRTGLGKPPKCSGTGRRRRQ